MHQSAQGSHDHQPSALGKPLVHIPNLELDVHVEEGPLHVEDTRGGFAAQPPLHGCKAALCCTQDGLNVGGKHATNGEGRSSGVVVSCRTIQHGVHLVRFASHAGQAVTLPRRCLVLEPRTLYIRLL